jgi:hypothetical protein
MAESERIVNPKFHATPGKIACHIITRRYIIAASLPQADQSDQRLPASHPIHHDQSK